MKNLYPLSCSLALAAATHAQTTLLTENFESQTICGNATFDCVANGSCALANG